MLEAEKVEYTHFSIVLQSEIGVIWVSLNFEMVREGSFIEFFETPVLLFNETFHAQILHYNDGNNTYEFSEEGLLIKNPEDTFELWIDN